MLGDPAPLDPAGWSRRDFARSVLGTAAVAAVGVGTPARAADDSLLAAFCRSLRPEQRRELILSSDDPRRSMVQNHWAIVPSPIAALTSEQQDLALGLIRQACTTDGFNRLTRGRDDDSGGWKHDQFAIFGDPADSGRAEWVVTGRHLTLRGSATGAITGGPLFLGHSVAGSASIWHQPADLAARWFRTLNAPEQAQATGDLGLDLGQIQPAQQIMARSLLTSLVEPFRRFAVPSVPACLNSATGLVGVRWQVFVAGAGSITAWRLVGPGFRWSFHAEPHVHLWFDSI